MISKELFEEVYSAVYMLKYIPSEPSLIRWYANDFDVKHEIYVSVNIYELANKCKEWAYDLGYDIETAPSGWIRISFDDNILYSHSGFENEKQECFNAIKACQWILDNKDIG